MVFQPVIDMGTGLGAARSQDDYQAALAQEFLRRRREQQEQAALAAGQGSQYAGREFNAAPAPARAMGGGGGAGGAGGTASAPPRLGAKFRAPGAGGGGLADPLEGLRRALTYVQAQIDYPGAVKYNVRTGKFDVDEKAVRKIVGSQARAKELKAEIERREKELSLRGGEQEIAESEAKIRAMDAAIAENRRRGDLEQRRGNMEGARYHKDLDEELRLKRDKLTLEGEDLALRRGDLELRRGDLELRRTVKDEELAFKRDREARLKADGEARLRLREFEITGKLNAQQVLADIAQTREARMAEIEIVRSRDAAMGQELDWLAALERTANSLVMADYDDPVMKKKAVEILAYIVGRLESRLEPVHRVRQETEGSLPAEATMQQPPAAPMPGAAPAQQQMPPPEVMPALVARAQQDGSPEIAADNMRSVGMPEEAIMLIIQQAFPGM